MHPTHPRPHSSCLPAQQGCTPALTLSSENTLLQADKEDSAQAH